jgi:hypothetical protein
VTSSGKSPRPIPEPAVGGAAGFGLSGDAARASRCQRPGDVDDAEWVDDDDDLLAEQRAFYRARAPEYDQWWQRRGHYDRGSGETHEWERQVAVVDTALASFGATGDVLELAGGTG